MNWKCLGMSLDRPIWPFRVRVSKSFWTGHQRICRLKPQRLVSNLALALRSQAAVMEPAPFQMSFSSNSIFSLDEDNSTLSIDEGTSGDLTFLFSPTGAGVFNETVELYTNDPNNSVITIPLTATGISEVSGEVCDVTWSLADSPFTLVGGVTVAEGCTLTIEPGVTVEMQGFTLDMNGDLVCNGTAENPVTVIGGSIDIGPGTPMSVSYLNYVSSGEQPEVTYDAPIRTGLLQQF